MKNKKTKLKVLATAAAMVLAVGATAVTTWALTKTNVTSNFEATFIGARDVEATINGASYLASGETATKVEQISEIKFLPTSTTSDVTANFTKAITVVNESDYIYYEFSIKNDSGKSSYSDLIVNPVATITAGDAAVASGFYFSADNVTYSALGADYITIAKGDTVYLRLKAQLVDTSKDISFAGNMQLNLYTEKSAPAAYKADYEYSISNGEAYRTTIYTDGSKSATSIKMLSHEYIIATPDNAQKILDNDFNGKVVIFDGVFNDILEIRPSKATAEVRATNDQSAAVLDVETLDILTSYYYTRNIEDVVFTATEDTQFKNMLLCESGTIAYMSPASYWGTNRYDAVKENNVWVGGVGAVPYYASINMNNIVYTNMNFVGKTACIVIGDTLSANVEYHATNILVSYCEFDADGAVYVDSDKNPAAICVGGAQTYENIVAKNNKVNGNFQGFYTSCVTNVKVYNNDIKNTHHNAIAVQSNDVYAFQGKIVIVNNSVANTTDRGIRFGTGLNANIVLEGNTFVNCAEDRTAKNQGVQLLKSEALTNATYTFVNNTYGGEAMENFKGNDSTFIVYIEEPVA